MTAYEQLYKEYPLWQMNTSERAATLYLLEHMEQRKYALEIGSYRGGFTQILAGLFDKVISVDIDHSNIVEKDNFKNVIWVQERSSICVSKILKKYEEIDFILIDADHDTAAVYQDIKNCYKHAKEGTLILVHDSCYEPSKVAIETAKRDFKFTFIDGNFVTNAFGIGGLCLIHK